MIPKKGSKQITYNGHTWRYKVTLDKEKLRYVNVIYNTPDGKFHKTDIIIIHFWDNNKKVREFTPLDFINIVIYELHHEYYLHKN